MESISPSDPGKQTSQAANQPAERVAAGTIAVFHHGGAGCGTLWGPQLAVTNHHVVPGDRARLLAAAGDIAEARVIARDSQADLVLLRAPIDGAAALALRIAPPLRAGELVYAMGNPWGERNVLTAGVVVASGAIDPPDGRVTAIRADLALAPGNSGGPMVDARGQVVGINSMIAGGLAVAIPAAVVERFVRSALAAGAAA